MKLRRKFFYVKFMQKCLLHKKLKIIMLDFCHKHLKSYNELLIYRKKACISKHTTYKDEIFCKDPNKQEKIREYLKMKNKLIKNIEEDLHKNIANNKSMLKTFLFYLYLKGEKFMDQRYINSLLMNISENDMYFYKLIEYWKFFLAVKHYERKIKFHAHDNANKIKTRMIFSHKNLLKESNYENLIRTVEYNEGDMQEMKTFLKKYKFEGKEELLSFFDKKFITDQNISEESLSNFTETAVSSSTTEDLEKQINKIAKQVQQDFSMSSDIFDTQSEIIDTEIIEEQKKVKLIEKEENNNFVYFKGVKFQNLKFLGAGATAKVFLVKPAHNFGEVKKNENYALKSIYLSNKIMERNIINEIELMKDLKENVIKLFDYEIKENCFQILMEAGEMDLFSFLSSKKSFHNKKFCKKNVFYFEDEETEMGKYGFLNKNGKSYQKIENYAEEDMHKLEFDEHECINKNCKYYWPFTRNCKDINFFGFLSTTEIKNLLEMLFDIFVTLSTNQIIHRDIKHKNFVFVKNKLKVIDFGLSRKISEEASNHNTQGAGTHSFISPEAIKNNEVSRKSDIWPLGNIIHEIIFGELRFKGDGPDGIYSFLSSKEKKVEVGFCKDECSCKSNLAIFEEIFFNSLKKKADEVVYEFSDKEKLTFGNLINLEDGMCDFHRKMTPCRAYVPFIFLIGKCLVIEPESRYSIFELRKFYYEILSKIEEFEC